MIEIKEVKEEDILSAKENHALSCFTDYLYHKHASDPIQGELADIVAELSSGFTSVGIIKASKGRGSCIPQENELPIRGHELVQEQDKYEEVTEVVYGWLTKIKNPDHKDIIVEYLISNRGENAEIVADLCSTSSSNVYKAAKGLIKNFAGGIP